MANMHAGVARERQQQAASRLEHAKHNAVMPGSEVANAPAAQRMWQQRQRLNEKEPAQVGSHVQGTAAPFRLWQQRQANQHNEWSNHAMGNRGVVKAPWE